MPEDKLKLLQAYLDTGLTPDEITNIKIVNGNLVRQNEKLNQRRKLLQAYIDTGLTADECMQYKIFEDEIVTSGKSFNHIIELLKAEEQGLLQNMSCEGCKCDDSGNISEALICSNCARGHFHTDFFTFKEQI